MQKAPSEMKHKREVITEWIDLIQTEGRSLTAWEESFVDDLAAQLDERGSISDRQEEILERIYSEKTP